MLSSDTKKECHSKGRQPSGTQVINQLNNTISERGKQWKKKTLEVSVDKFMELCRTDARMDALISYIESEEVAQYDYINVKTIKAIIGMCDE